MLLPSYMPPEHDATAIQLPSIPGKINWLALHASVFRRNSTSKKKQYLGVCLVAQVQTAIQRRSSALDEQKAVT